jgi:hypothetical protein
MTYSFQKLFIVGKAVWNVFTNFFCSTDVGKDNDETKNETTAEKRTVCPLTCFFSKKEKG